VGSCFATSLARSEHGSDILNVNHTLIPHFLTEKDQALALFFFLLRYSLVDNMVHARHYVLQSAIIAIVVAAHRSPQQRPPWATSK
jgi:hypothetical protein